MQVHHTRDDCDNGGIKWGYKRECYICRGELGLFTLVYIENAAQSGPAE